MVLQWTALWTTMLQTTVKKNTAVRWRLYFMLLIDMVYIAISFCSNNELKIKIKILLNINICCFIKITDQMLQIFAVKAIQYTNFYLPKIYIIQLCFETTIKFHNPRPKVHVDNLQLYHANLKTYIPRLKTYLNVVVSFKIIELNILIFVSIGIFGHLVQILIEKY